MQVTVLAARWGVYEVLQFAFILATGCDTPLQVLTRMLIAIAAVAGAIMKSA
jgi:hypothetical protein